jgi:hypothetical protein
MVCVFLFGDDVGLIVCWVSWKFVGLVGGSFGRFSDFIFGGCWADEARPTYGLLCQASGA